MTKSDYAAYTFALRILDKIRAAYKSGADLTDIDEDSGLATVFAGFYAEHIKLGGNHRGACGYAAARVRDLITLRFCD